MGPFAMAAIVLEVIFWVALLAVAGGFLVALIKGSIEDIRDHRRIVAARTATAAPPSAQDPRLPRIFRHSSSNTDRAEAA